MVKVRKIKDLRKVNKGNTSPRKDSQIFAAAKRMLLDNPLKKPLNRVNQSMRMWGNQFWKRRKKELIKQQPLGLMGITK